MANPSTAQQGSIEADQRRNVGNSSTAAAQANIEESERAKASAKSGDKTTHKPGKPKDDPSLAPESGDKLDADKDL